MKKFLVRAVISIGILAFLLSRIDLESLKCVFGRFNPAIYLLAVLIIFFHQSLWTLAWKIALGQKKYHIRFIDIYRTILISQFFGIFIPTTAGPDLVLTYNIGKVLPEKEHAFSSLLFIRSLNIFSNLAISGILLLCLPLNSILKQLLIITWILVILIALGFWIATHRKTKAIADKIFIEKWAILKSIRKVLTSFSQFGRDYSVLLKLSFLSIIMAFVRVSVDYTVALSLGINIPFYWFLALIPSITIISCIPVTIGGLGIREGAYMGIFANIGLVPAGSISISLLLFTVILLMNITGGIVYCIYGSWIKYTKQ